MRWDDKWDEMVVSWDDDGWLWDGEMRWDGGKLMVMIDEMVDEMRW